MEQEIMRKLSVLSILRDIAREWLTILVIAISVSLLSYVSMTMRYVPNYYTHSTIAVSARGSSSDAYTNLSTAQGLAGDLASIFDSTVLKKKVMEDLELPAFDARVQVKQVEETNLIEIGVTTNDCLKSYRILRSMMENYHQVADYVMGSVVLETIEEPVVATAPVNPLNIRQGMIRGGLMGLVGAVFLAVFFSFKRDTIKKESMLTDKVDAKLLGTIYHERKSKRILPGKKKQDEDISMLINNPLRSFWFVEANRMTASRVRSAMNRRKAKVVMITSVTENEGKSTVVSNLAMCLAREVNKVLLIDCDFRKPALYKIFQLRERDTCDLPAVFKSCEGFEQAAIRYKDSNLYLVANRVADDAEDLLEGGGLKKLIDTYRDEMDYIILDSAPMALVSDTEDLANQVDASILVVREDVVVASSINDAVDILNATHGKVLGCIYNNAMRQPGIATGYHGYESYGGHYGKTAN